MNVSPLIKKRLYIWEGILEQFEGKKSYPIFCPKRKCLNGVTRSFELNRHFYNSWPLRILCAETAIALLCNAFRSWKYFKRVYCYVNQMLKIAIKTENVPIFSPLEEYWSSKSWWLVRGSHELEQAAWILRHSNSNWFHSFKISPWPVVVFEQLPIKIACSTIYSATKKKKQTKTPEDSKCSRYMEFAATRWRPIGIYFICQSNILRTAKARHTTLGWQKKKGCKEWIACPRLS